MPSVVNREGKHFLAQFFGALKWQLQKFLRPNCRTAAFRENTAKNMAKFGWVWCDLHTFTYTAVQGGGLTIRRSFFGSRELRKCRERQCENRQSDITDSAITDMVALETVQKQVEGH